MLILAIMMPWVLLLMTGCSTPPTRNLSNGKTWLLYKDGKCSTKGKEVACYKSGALISDIEMRSLVDRIFNNCK